MDGPQGMGPLSPFRLAAITPQTMPMTQASTTTAAKTALLHFFYNIIQFHDPFVFYLIFLQSHLLTISLMIYFFEERS